MTRQIKKLNSELFDDFELNKKVTTRSILEKLTKLRRLVRKQINDARCSWCDSPATTFRDKVSAQEFLVSGLCQTCQDETFKETN